ncbi:MAG TPA: hypothetical protein VKU61_14065 [Candidatus Binatia bacterium]|nr:hypothetical protein [Candidatus Binatia bacterium]
MAGRRRLGLPFSLLLLLAGSRVWALVPGGRVPRADCLAEWQVTRRNVVPSRGSSALDCQDGDPTCDADGQVDGSCTFNVSLCILQNDPMRPECTAPAALTSLRGLTAGLEHPASMSRSACGRAMPLTAILRTRRRRVSGPARDPHIVPASQAPSRPVRVHATAVGGGLRDVNRLVLRCVPPPVTCPDARSCPDNDGPLNPNELVLAMGGTGTDLDLGWTGRGHDLPVALGTELHVCLEGCDFLFDPSCDTRIVTGPGTANGALFGPPIPVLANGVPLCLVHEFDDTLFTGGTADLSTGAFTATIGLRAKTFLTDPDAICPGCNAGGRCEGGANDGGACRVDRLVLVPGGKFAVGYAVSRDCPPADDQLVDAASVRVPLTTGESQLTPLPGGDGQRPCTAQPAEPVGVPPQANGCATTCDARCTGDACDAPGHDSASGALLCIDARGGVGQVCCADDTTRPCFATPVTRSGFADVPVPRWDDHNPGEFPKRNDVEMVGTFCLPATGRAAVDALLGLPGPGALVLPARATWNTPAPCTGGGGRPPAPY